MRALTKVIIRCCLVLVVSGCKPIPYKRTAEVLMLRAFCMDAYAQNGIQPSQDGRLNTVRLLELLGDDQRFTNWISGMPEAYRRWVVAGDLVTLDGRVYQISVVKGREKDVLMIVVPAGRGGWYRYDGYTNLAEIENVR